MIQRPIPKTCVPRASQIVSPEDWWGSTRQSWGYALRNVSGNNGIASRRTSCSYFVDEIKNQDIQKMLQITKFNTSSKLFEYGLETDAVRTRLVLEWRRYRGYLLGDTITRISLKGTLKYRSNEIYCEPSRIEHIARDCRMQLKFLSPFRNRETPKINATEWRLIWRK